MKRPKIEEFFPQDITLSAAAVMYRKNSNLYNYMQSVDSYADCLEVELAKLTEKFSRLEVTPINNTNNENPKNDCNVIENYTTALQGIYDHVGFIEDHVVAPIDDSTDQFWEIDGDIVRYADSKEELRPNGFIYYEDHIYKNRFYSKWIYEGQFFTMIFCDPRVDNMKLFRIFDNSKRTF